MLRRLDLGGVCVGCGEGIDQLVDWLRAAHPRLGANAAHPVGKARDEAEIFDHMLLADKPHRNDAAVETVIVGPKKRSSMKMPSA